MSEGKTPWLDAKTSPPAPAPKPQEPAWKNARDMTAKELRAFERAHKIRR